MKNAQARREDGTMLTHYPAHWFCLAVAIGSIALAGRAVAQVADRTIDELKVEAQARADRGAYPLGRLDSRKETVAETYAAALPFGIGFVAIDSPGTGEAPVKASETADRMYSRLIDYLATRPEIDKTRLLVHGQSFGGYWAAKLAHTERARLLGVIAQSPAVHTYYQADYFRPSMYTREYLFDRVPAYLAVYGKASLDELFEYLPRMSLQTLGLLGQPTAPLFIVGGVKDTQVPIADLDLLIHTGAGPREAWINAAGGHMGRERTGWTDPVIFRKVILPWEVRMVASER
jgi:esterase FrsA